MPLKDKRPNPSNAVYELAFTPDKSQPTVQPRPQKPSVSPALATSAKALSEPRKTNTWRNLLLFMMLLLVCLPVLLLNLGQPDVVNLDEASNILRSSQTWNRYETLTTQRGFSLEGLIPYENGQASLDEPPGLTWTHMIWFMTLNPHHATPSQLILRARLCSVFFAVLTLICIYWAGYSLGRHRTGLFSLLIFGANPVFIYYARLATPTMLHTGWAMLAIATSLWAIRPLRPLPSTERQFLGWIVCGLALGAGTLAAGPVTLVTIVAPIFLLILFCPDRVSHLIGLLASLLIGVLIVAPWLMYAHEHNPQVWDHWLTSIIPVKQLEPGFLWHQSLVRLAWLAVVFSPWILWILAVVAQPLSRSSKGMRRISLWLASGWSIGVAALVLPMPTPTVFSELLPLIVPVCLAIGQLFNHLNDLCKTQHHPRTWRWLRWPQSCIFLALSLLIPWGLANEQTLISSGYYPAALAMNIPSHIIFSLLFALLGLWILSLGGVVNHRPSRAVTCWSLWCLVLVTILISPLSRSTAATHLGRDETLALSKILDQAAVLWVQKEVEPKPLDPRVLFYIRRTVPSITQSQLDRALLTLTNDSSANCVVLISPMNMKLEHPGIRAMGMLRYSRLRLWRYDIAATTSPTIKNEP